VTALGLFAGMPVANSKLVATGFACEGDSHL
jgi:hypothetical protein